MSRQTKEGCVGGDDGRTADRIGRHMAPSRPCCRHCGLPLLASLLLSSLLRPRPHFVNSTFIGNSSSVALPVRQDASTVRAAVYTRSVVHRSADATLIYGDARALRARDRPLVPGETYGAFVASMPIVCVDVALTRSDGRVLLVKRHAEPVKGVYWWPGGRLLLGESFLEAALRKIRGELGGGGAIACRGPLGTWNTLFERSAWHGGAPTQTVNVLVHVHIPREADAEGLRICGDQQGRCATTGEFGFYKWVAPSVSAGESRYILDGLAVLRARGGRCEPVDANPLAGNERHQEAMNTSK